MAIVWGPTVNDRWSVGIEITQTASTDSAVTLRADYYFWARYDIRDSNNSFSASGSFGSTSGSRSVSTGTSGGTVSLGSQSKTFSRAYGSTSSVSQSISFSGLEAVGATLTASASYTIPARPYSAPPAPSNLASTRSGTSASVSWTNHHSTSASSATYASGIRVFGYYQAADGSSVPIFTVDLANTATSYTRTGLNTTQAVTMGVTALNNNGANTTWTGWTYPTPAAPTLTNVVRNSDTQYTISFKTNAPAYPNTYTLIERSTSDGTWTQIASVSPTATSYLDRSTSANNFYRYRVRTVYGNAYSVYSTSGTYYNTPAKPSNVRAAKNSDNSVTVSWNDNSRTETGFSLQRSQDGGATWATVTSSITANATSYIDLAAPGGSLTYRVEAHRQPLYSGWSAPSPSITTIAPPKAPTITNYPRETVSTESGGFTIGWLHNPVDGSAQTAAEIAILPPGGSTETFVSITGATSTYRVDTTATGTYRINIRTKGAHADWSPWASYVYVTIAEPPTVIITAPATDGTVIAAIPYTTSWTYDGAGYDPVSVDYHIQRQEDDGSWTTVYLEQKVAGSGSVTLDADTVIPRNGETYRVHVWARAASGLTTTADRVFTTDYVLPQEPEVAVTTDTEKLSAQVSIEDMNTYDDLMFGGVRNLLADGYTTKSGVDYLVATYTPTTPLTKGVEYHFTIDLTPAEGVNLVRLYVSNGSAAPFAEIPVAGGVRQVVTATGAPNYIDGKTPDDNIINADIRILRLPNDGTVTDETTIHWMRATEQPDTVGVNLLRNGNLYTVTLSDEYYRDPNDLFGDIPIIDGQTYTLRMDYEVVATSLAPTDYMRVSLGYREPGGNYTRYMGIYLSHASTGSGAVSKTFTASRNIHEPNANLFAFLFARSGKQHTSEVNYSNIKLEVGDTPAFDDVTPLPTPDSYTVLRITDEGETMLATDLISGGVVDDPIPPLNKTYTYRIISHAASGAISEQDVEAYVDSPSTFAINFGAGMADLRTLRWNVSYDTDGSKEQQHQAYEGRKFPVLYSGSRRNETHSISATILREEVLDWSALDDWGGVCVLRTNCGQRIPVSENHSIGRAYNNVPSISVKMERVDYELG